MAKIPGMGGILVLQNGGQNIRVDNSEYEVDIDIVIDDVTDSSVAPASEQAAQGALASAQGLPCLVKINSITFSVPEDSTASPFLLGFSEGGYYSFFLKHGALALYDLVTNTIFKNSRVSNPSDRARRLTFTFEYGTYSRNVNGPAGF